MLLWILRVLLSSIQAKKLSRFRKKSAETYTFGNSAFFLGDFLDGMTKQRFSHRFIGRESSRSESHSLCWLWLEFSSLGSAELEALRFRRLF